MPPVPPDELLPAGVPELLQRPGGGAVQAGSAAMAQGTEHAHAALRGADATGTGGASRPIVAFLSAAAALAMRPVRSLLYQLGVELERESHEERHRRYQTKTRPLSLGELGLRRGDEIAAFVTLGYSKVVRWPATVRSAAEVLWAPMAEHGAPAPSVGHVKFVLTHEGKRIYDEDYDLYYEYTKLGGTPGDDVGHGSHSTRRPYLLIRVLVLLLAVANPRLTWQLLLLLWRRPLISFFGMLASVVAVRTVYRYFWTDDLLEEEDGVVEVEEE
jgi:hypothetical protein